MTVSLPQFARAGWIARFKPLHRVHAAILHALARRTHRLVLGIGSANRYTPRNPLTWEESAGMAHAELSDRTGAAAELSDRLELVPVPDVGDGPRWAQLVVSLFGPLDLFVTANPYVAELLGNTYELIHPLDLVAPALHQPIDGQRIRVAWARGDPWRHLVTPAVAGYLDDHRLPERFRREFGLQTLARELERAQESGPVSLRDEEERHVLLG